MLASLMPGWTPEHVKARLHNYKRLMKADTKETGGAELRIALADIVNRVPSSNTTFMTVPKQPLFADTYR